MTDNLSNTSKQVEIHRHGEFWTIHPKTYKASISRIDVYRIAKLLGFCVFRGDLYKVVGKFVCISSEREFQDSLKGYVEQNPQLDEVINALENFMQKNGKYTISRLPIIQDEMFLNDNEANCFKFFKNCFIHITKDGYSQHTYDQIPPDKYILFSKVQQRDFKPATTGLYLEFLSLATDWEHQHDNIYSILGYLAHEFRDETTGYIVVLTEQCPDPKDGGGSGKNLFCNLLSNTTTYCSKNGKQLKFDEKFFQSWSGQRIMGISDVPKNFDFEFLKEPSTGTFILKKLFKDEIEIPVSDGPKFIVQTNYSYEITDGGLKRRIMPIEFTDYFTKAGGVDVHFNCHFPKGWSENDWNNFDTVIIKSVSMWLKLNRKLKSAQLTETGWEKQFEHTHGKNMADFIRDNFKEWADLGTVKSEDIRSKLKIFYQDNDINIKYHYSSQRLAAGIKEWSIHHGYECSTNKQVKELGINFKAYVFQKVTE